MPSPMKGEWTLTACCHAVKALPLLRANTQQGPLTSKSWKYHLKVDATNVSLGGKDVCVMLIYNGPEKSMLHWLGTEARCELQGFPVKGNHTLHLVHIATTFFRALFRDVKHLHLIDSSSYKCALQNGKLYPISLRESYFLFHGKTYYEDKFHAFPRTADAAETMAVFRAALHDPSKKPAVFRFMDDELQTVLTPLYNTSRTWWDFFQAIQTRWGSQKCTMIYKWHRYALAEMHTATIPEHWTIDITKLPWVHPQMKKIGGGKSTRKHRRVHMYPLDELWDGSFMSSVR